MKIFILANREHVRADVAASYPQDEIALFLYKPDMQPFLEVALEFGRAVIAGSTVGETIRLVVAGPVAIAYILGMAFAHASRHIIFAYLDLEKKRYVDLDLSDHRRVHL